MDSRFRNDISAVKKILEAYKNRIGFAAYTSQCGTCSVTSAHMHFLFSLSFLISFFPSFLPYFLPSSFHYFIHSFLPSFLPHSVDLNYTEASLLIRLITQRILISLHMYAFSLFHNTQILLLLSSSSPCRCIRDDIGV